MAKTTTRKKPTKRTKAQAKSRGSVMDEVVELAEEYKRLDLEAKELEAKRKEKNKQAMAVSEKLCKLVDRAELQPPFHLSSGGKVFVRQEISVKTEDAEALMHWLEANDHGDIIKSSVHGGTLKKFIKELEAENKPYPEGVTVTDYMRAVYSK